MKRGALQDEEPDARPIDAGDPLMRKTEKAALTSVIASALMAAGMIVTSVITGSVSILAQGIHTAIDSIASIAVLVGLKLSDRHTERFPFGLYKLENLIATIIGILILIGAYELAREAINQLTTPGPKLDKPVIMLIVMPVVIVATGLMARYMSRVARQENSPSLRASSRDAFADMASSFAVLIAAALETAGVSYADGIAALVVVLFLVWSGMKVTLDGLKVLLDASVEREVLDEVRSIAEQDPRIKKVLRVEGRNSGRYRFLSLLIVPRTNNLEEAHRAAEELEKNISSQVPNVDRVRIEFEVEEKDKLVFAVPVDDDKGSVAAHFGKAPSFAIMAINLKDGSVITHEILANPFYQLEKQKGVRAAEFLGQQGVDFLISTQTLEGKGALYAIKEQGIDVLYRPEVTPVVDAEKVAIEYSTKPADRRE